MTSHIPAGTKVIEASLIHAGEERTYRVLIPASYDGARAVPLILALHGGGGEGRVMCSLRNGIQEFALELNYLIVCPDGIENHWNDGRAVTKWRAHADKIDDVGFLRTLIEQLKIDYNLDPVRIYATGVSNGGKMTLRLACEASDLLAGAAAVIATLPTDLECTPGNSVPILVMNGTEDPLVPYEGGQVHFLRQNLGAALSTSDTIDFWRRNNRCTPVLDAGWLPDLDPDDGTRIWREAYVDCESGAQVILYKVEGGGHTWPGGNQYVPEFLIGRVSHDARAGELILDFFESTQTIAIETRVSMR